MWILTIDPFIGIPVFIAKLPERQYCWRVFEDFRSQEYISFFLHTQLPLRAFALLHSRIWLSQDCTISSKYPFQHYSSPFVLIMCIDARESTTNSLSTGFNVDAGRHLFSEGEKSAALWCSFNFDTFLVSFHAASRALCSCHFVSSWDRYSNFGALGLRWWFTWTNVTERGILVWNFGMTCNGFCELRTLDRLRHVSALPEKWISAVSCPEMRNPIAVHQKLDI